jgi:T5SS/PEP-CTERM-associated repeat protein
MRRFFLTWLAVAGWIVQGDSARAVDYFWNNASGGAYDEPSNWAPFAPPATQGPGGAIDTVNFDLGVAPASRYVVTDAGRENSQLIVHNDSVELTIFVRQEFSSAGGGDPSLVVGAASGDLAHLALSAGGASVIETDVTRIANAAGSEGYLSVEGLEWIGGNVRVGYAGEGRLDVFSDATVSSANVSLAHLTGSSGEARVLGAWEMSGSLLVGRQGPATLEVLSTGGVSSNAADAAGGSGEVTVAGAWNVAGALTVGDSGQGTLIVNSGGAVVGGDAFVGRQTGSSGVAAAGTGTWTINGRLSIGGDADAAVSGGDGLVEIAGGDVAVAEDVTLFPNGQISLVGGSLDSPIISMQSGAAFDWAGGELRVDTFNGNLSNNGGTLAAREGSNSILVSGEYVQGSLGVLSIDVADSAASAQFDNLAVGNTAFLGGILEINLANPFEPAAEDAYIILDALNIVGQFANVANGERVLVGRDEGSFLVNYGVGSPFDPSQVVLSDFRPMLDADFNDDGHIDEEDLAQWRGDFGVNELSDADGDEDSDGTDFLLWQQQLRLPPVEAAVAAVAAAVPEPGSILLAVLAIAALGARGRLTSDVPYDCHAFRHPSRRRLRQLEPFCFLCRIADQGMFIRA